MIGTEATRFVDPRVPDQKLSEEFRTGVIRLLKVGFTACTMFGRAALPRRDGWRMGPEKDIIDGLPDPDVDVSSINVIAIASEPVLHCIYECIDSGNYETILDVATEAIDCGFEAVD